MESENNQIQLESNQTKIEKKLEKLNNRKDKVEDGFSFYLALTTNKISKKRRKFLLDYGENLNKNRLSLYIDSENNIVLRLYNEYEEVNTCIVPAESYSFHDGVPFFIYCDVGFSTRYSFLRIRINDREICRNEIEAKINFISETFFSKTRKSSYSMVRRLNRLNNDYSTERFFKNNYKGMFCADMEGNNPSNFYPLELQIYGWLLNEREIDNLWEGVRDTVFEYSSFFEKHLQPFNTAYEIKNGYMERIDLENN